mmetsp:Transcript_4865/g.9788  ORF Transcript_4865/g.9788 Transcript_4865/m.9788 type:complete len:125 (+) Transcript_4865:294-668(+)
MRPWHLCCWIGFGGEEERIYVSEGGACWRLKGVGVWRCVDRMVREIRTSEESQITSAATENGGLGLNGGNLRACRTDEEIDRAFKKALMDCITRDGFREVGRRVEKLVEEDEDVRKMLKEMWGW